MKSLLLAAWFIVEPALATPAHAHAPCRARLGRPGDYPVATLAEGTPAPLFD